MPLTNDDIDEVVQRFRREADRYAKLGTIVADACRLIVRDDAIPATIQWRSKEPDRLRGKVTKDRDSFESVDDVFDKVKDFAGVRVLTYADSDRQRVVDAIRKRFNGRNPADEVVVEVREFPLPSFYRATHCQVWLRPDDLVPPNENLEDTTCEIQVCSLLAHVWNEIEHDLVYKVLAGEPSAEERHLLETVGYTIRSGDGQVSQLVAATQTRLAQLGGVFRNQWDFVARIQPLFPNANDIGTYSGQLFDELMASEVTTPQSVSQLIGADGAEQAGERIAAVNGYLDAHGDDVVRFESNTSDELAILYLWDHAEQVVARHPGQGRPPRIASLARRVLQYRIEAGV